MNYLDKVNLMPYKFDLSVARSDEEYNIQGMVLYITRCDDEVYIKINDKNSAPIDLRIVKIIRIPFERIYITNPSRHGELNFIISNILTIPEPLNLSTTFDLTGVITESDIITKHNLEDTILKRHTQNTDTALNPLTADINANSHKITNLGAPAQAGDSLRATNIITESSLEDAISKRHTQNTDTALNPLTADINANSHKITNLGAPAQAGDSLRATNIITESALETTILRTASYVLEYRALEFEI